MLAANLDFDTERGTNITALDNATADPDIAGKVGSLQRVVEGTAARIADERMTGLAKLIV